MKYTYDFEIQYQEVDMNRKLRLYTLENYLLNVAGRCADSLGFGVNYLSRQNRTWILTRLALEMRYMPANCDHIVFETWIESNNHMLSTRDFRIYMDNNGSRELIGCAKTVWAVLDLTKREVVNCFDDPAFANAVDGEVLDLPRMPRTLPITEPDGVVEHVIQYSDVDYNRHCNSCKYLENMLNACLPKFLTGPFRLDINYAKEVYLGDTLTTYYLEDKHFVQYAQKDVNATTCCSARIAEL